MKIKRVVDTTKNAKFVDAISEKLAKYKNIREKALDIMARVYDIRPNLSELKQIVSKIDWINIKVNVLATKNPQKLEIINNNDIKKLEEAITSLRVSSPKNVKATESKLIKLGEAKISLIKEKNKAAEKYMSRVNHIVMTAIIGQVQNTINAMFAKSENNIELESEDVLKQTACNILNLDISVNEMTSRTHYYEPVTSAKTSNPSVENEKATTLPLSRSKTSMSLQNLANEEQDDDSNEIDISDVASFEVLSSGSDSDNTGNRECMLS